MAASYPGAIKTFSAITTGTILTQAHFDEMHDEIEILSSHVRVGGVVPALEVLARGEGETQPLRQAAGDRHRTGATFRAFHPAGAELVKIPAIGPQARNLNVDGMAPSGIRHRSARRDDLRESLVVGHHPRDFHRLGPHAATGFQRPRREPRPQHDTVGRGIARSDTQRKRIRGKRRLRGRVQTGIRQQRRRGERQRGADERAPTEDGLIAHGEKGGIHRKRFSGASPVAAPPAPRSAERRIHAAGRSRTVRAAASP